MNIPRGRLTKSWGTSNVLIVALLTLCSPVMRSAARAHSQGPAAESRRVAPGLWGGDHVRMTVSRIGARLEYDCADSTIDQPIILDARGRFTAKGSYTPARGGPRRNGEAAAGRARYVGEVRADTMRLTVTLENTKPPVGVFTLRRGDDPLLTKCR
jgi:hypothetical protein